jgi:hypothetical protein
MLEWMMRRESKFARIGKLITEAIETAGLSEELQRLDRDHRSLLQEVTDEVVKSWIGFHGSRISPATQASVAVEVIRRASHRTGGSAVA